MRLGFDLRVYPLEVVYNAAYVFLSRCFVRLDRAGERNVSVRLTARESADRRTLAGLVGEFENELADQYVRARLSQRHTKLREMIVGRALRGAADDYLAGPPGIETAEPRAWLKE